MKTWILLISETLCRKCFNTNPNPMLIFDVWLRRSKFTSSWPDSLMRVSSRIRLTKHSIVTWNIAIFLLFEMHYNCISQDIFRFHHPYFRVNSVVVKWLHFNYLLNFELHCADRTILYMFFNLYLHSYHAL